MSRTTAPCADSMRPWDAELLANEQQAVLGSVHPVRETYVVNLQQ